MTNDFDDETAELVKRWIVTFCEMPIIVDPELMRAVLDGPLAQGDRR